MIRIPIGAIVRTLDDDGSADWTAEYLEARAAVPRGIEGYVIDSSDRHGLCYLVWHIEHGIKAWYNHAELEWLQR
jgi:hypothetical protein